MPDDFPYRSHGQPITAYASLLACLFILIVANGAGLWKEFHVQPFLSAYLAVSTSLSKIASSLLTILIADIFHRPLDLVESLAEGTMASSGPEWRGAGAKDAQAA
jgi:hypothetical protein